MSVTPKISLVAYESRDLSWVFVMVPDVRGRYMLVPRCVVEVPCPLCNSTVGVPCIGRQGYMIEVHHSRRSSWRSKRKREPTARRALDQMPDKPHIKLRVRPPPRRLMLRGWSMSRCSAGFYLTCCACAHDN